jgi:hypothetical protein
MVAAQPGSHLPSTVVNRRSEVDMAERADLVGQEGGALESRRVVATYDAYEDAQTAVDELSDQGFPVERVAIVGRDLRWVEQVTGRLNLLGAAVEGALAGAFAGTVVGFLLGLFVVDDTDAIALLLFGLAVGAVFGALWGLLSHWATGGRRDFTSVPSIVADSYDVVADSEVATEAERLLATSSRSRPVT